MNYIIIENANLKQYNTLRLNVTAAILVLPINIQGVADILNTYDNVEMIGNGSNILFSKEYYDYKTIFMNLKLLDDINISNHNEITCQSGVTLSKLSWFAFEKNVSGLEFLEDIPGSLGGAVIMNAGTYKDTIGQFINKVTYFDKTKMKIQTKQIASNDFGRRRSFFRPDKHIVLECKLKSDKKVSDYEEILDEMMRIKKNRYMKQPRNYPNAGSVFKRPTKNGKDYYVWSLIDELGLRGYAKGDALISNKHPGFIVNKGKATPNDMLNLIKTIQNKVKESFDIDLELEWKII